MSARTRRKKSAPAQTIGSAGAQPAQQQGRQPPAMPAWHWRTFPVYFAFALGGFLGLYMGLIAGATSNDMVSFVAFTFWAILLGFGFSRITSRWMVSHNWGRRFARKR